MKKQESLDTGLPNKLGIDLDVLLREGYKDFNINITEKDYDDEYVDENDIVYLPKQKYIDSNSIHFETPVSIDTTSSTENRLNNKRMFLLKKEFATSLLNCLKEEDFEFGFISRSEILIRDQFQINVLATRNCINELFIKNFDNEKILIGLLRVIGRFDESVIFPQGQTMALSALSHQNMEIKELGIRAFENWGTKKSLEVLKKIDVEPLWLREYLAQVVEDLTEELQPC